MSVEIPKVAVAFGSVTPPQGDIINLRVHLGCTNEVSSFECLLQNWDKKYSPGGSYPISVGMDGHIDIGRGSNVPQIITCRVESVKFESTPTANYIRVSGRCWGEKLFRRVVAKLYQNQKGEAIVKDLLDNYVSLSHTRDSTELVENTDTTYTKLDYDNTPVFDILKYIAKSADKNGVIGFDFRVAPDGKFEFFPRNSKTSPVSLTDKIEVSEYRKDIHGVRNKITVYGVKERTEPMDGDAWTEALTNWSATYGSVSLDDTNKKVGDYCILGTSELTENPNLYFRRSSINVLGGTKLAYYQRLRLWFKTSGLTPTSASLWLLQQIGPNKGFYTNLKTESWQHGEWIYYDFAIGPDATEWSYFNADASDWNNPILYIEFQLSGVGTGQLGARVDGLHFALGRYRSTQEDANSQNNYGLRELVEVDEELYSDNECELRAKALLNHLKDPAEYLTVRSTVIDYGNNPLLPGDKIHVTLPNENVDADFRILSVEYHVDAKTQTLEITLKLGRETPLLADYLYALRSKTDHLSRYKMARLIQA